MRRAAVWRVIRRTYHDNGNSTRTHHTAVASCPRLVHYGGRQGDWPGPQPCAAGIDRRQGEQNHYGAAARPA